MTLVIEKGVPIPQRGRQSGPLMEKLCNMEVGDSILVSDRKESNVRSHASHAHKSTGFGFTASKTSQGVRVWRVS